MKYQARTDEPLGAELTAFYHKMGFSEKFGRLLYSRGLTTKEDIDNFFDVSIDKLYDPFLLRGMQEAVSRIERAIKEREKILIIGDYDADGICSVAILYKYLLTRKAHTRYFLPDRNDDGYGLNIDVVKKLHKKFSPNLIITVDCGISCYKEVEYAKELGIDVIVTDHHAIPEVTPDCICIDPKFPDSAYPFSELCGAGVSLKLVQALGGIESAEKYIDICSIATVADIVPLKDENRVITSLGLAKLNNNSLPSVSALAKSCNIWGRITSSDISFKLGPKINASGRMGNAKRGLDMILEQDSAEIENIIQSLNNYNTQRQKLCNTIFEECDKVIVSNELTKNNIIIVSSDKWESGVLGIVSARVTEKFGKPSIIFGKAENIYKGSSRSIGEINIVKTIERFSELVLTYGGHSMAAGLSIAAERFQEFIDKITTHLNESYSHLHLRADKFYDFTLRPDEIKPELVREFELLEPVGCDNPMPTFAINTESLSPLSLPAYPSHLRFSTNNIHFMYFGGGCNMEILTDNCPKRIIFEFQKMDDTNLMRAIVKSIVPSPNNAKSYALALAGYIQGNFYVEDTTTKFSDIISALSIDRDVFVQYYKILYQYAEISAGSLYDLYAKIGNSELNLYQFVFCATVFQEIGIFTFENKKLVINDKVSTDLHKSAAYCFVREHSVAVVREEILA